MVRTIARLKEVTGVAIRLRDAVAAPTVRGVAAVIDHHKKSTEPDGPEPEGEVA
jgi:hypothetical protein